MFMMMMMMMNDAAAALGWRSSRKSLFFIRD